VAALPTASQARAGRSRDACSATDKSADNAAVESTAGRPTQAPGRHAFLPLHELCLFKLGIHLAELWYFGELAPWLKSHGRSRFLLTAPPLDLPGAVGSPVTPLATV